MTLKYHIDKTSETWAAVLSWCDAELQRSREVLESSACSQDDTARLRGNIDVLKRLQGLPLAQEKRIHARLSAE